MRQPDLFTPIPYGGHAGYREPQTSVEAAKHATRRMLAAHEAVLSALRKRPMTPDEIAREIGESILFIRPRCTELKEMGLVVATDERRANASGCKAYVLRIA